MSTSAPLVRGAHAPTLAIALWRNALAVPVLVALAVVVHRGAVGRVDVRGRPLRLTLLAGICLAAHFATWVPSLSFTSVSSSVALVATQPVWAALIARTRGEVVDARTWLGIGLAVTGVAMLGGLDFSVSGRALLGDALALAGGVFAAVYVTVGAEVRQQLSTTVYAATCYATASVVLAIVCAVGTQRVVGFEATTWWSIIAITAGPQLLGHTLMNRALRTMSATVVSVAILLEVIGATVLARIFFDETPHALAWPAGGLVLAGVVLVVSFRRALATIPAT